MIARKFDNVEPGLARHPGVAAAAPGRRSAGAAVALCALAGVFPAACGSKQGTAVHAATPPAPQPANSGKRSLKVMLYPYIPYAAADDGFEALRAELEKRFEAEHNDVDVSITMEKRALAKALDLYDPSAVAKALEAGTYDVIEIDAVTLGAMAGSKAIRQWPKAASSTWHPAGIEAFTLDTVLWGAPHWLCAHFVFSRAREPAEAKNAQDLLVSLDRLKTPAQDLIIDFDGSWNVPSLYLDALVDSNAKIDLSAVLSEAKTANEAKKDPTLDPATISHLESLTRRCEISKENPCVKGAYHEDETFSARDFAIGHSDALIGYSERLHYIRQASTVPVFVGTAPLGNGNNPIVFADGFVVRQGCDQRCEQDALAFAEFMNQPETMQYILLSEDTPAWADTRIPRYLLPATLDAFTPEVLKDPYYLQLRALVTGARSYPSRGLPEAKSALKSALKAAVK